ncbi:MAG: hypothetical protein C0606_12455 [Hyphomicrobiales bacterium]|nr:MAG: hypothetical protein C0606_12455 [Hyphomicrobiales bacterium]
MTNSLSRVLFAGTAIAVMATAGAAQAGGFALREQSAYFQGMSFAGSAAPGPSISSMFWNPATVTTAEGLVVESHSTLVVPDSDINVTSATLDPPFAIVPTPLGLIPGAAVGNGDDIGQGAFVPSFYSAYKVSEQVYVGLAVNGQYGLATNAPTAWAGQVYSRVSKVFSVNVNPTVGYKINDMVSIAAGLQAQYLKVRLSRATSIFSGAPSAELEGDDWGFGATLGVTFTPMEGTEIGIGYRSQIKHELSGSLFTGAISLPIDASITTPDMITASIRQRITDAFTLTGTVEWTNWSVLGTIPVTTTGGVVATTLPFNYEDGWFFAVGGEYAINEELTVRGCVGYELSPIDTNIRSTRLPDNDRLWLSAGLSYNVTDRLSVDLGYSHIFVEDADIRITPGHQDYAGVSLIGTAETDLDIVGVSVRYTLGGPNGS